MKLFVWIASLAWTTGCTVAAVPFECEADAQCTGGTSGRCERSGFCSFADSECDSQRRYDDLAGDLSNTCVVICPVQVEAGSAHTCTRKADGRVACWGAADQGQLGDGSTASAFQALPVEVDPDVDDVVDVSAGGTLSLDATATQFDVGPSHTCAIGEPDRVFCWGAGGMLQLGSTATVGPQLVSSLAGLGAPSVSVRAGGRHTCATTTVATVCWGANETGQVGIGMASPAEPPGAVLFAAGFREVDTGDRHSCGRTLTGSVHCWGSNDQLRLGLPATVSALPQPGERVGTLQAAQISAGLQHTCALTTDQEVHCWGDNQFGQLAQDILRRQLQSPQRVELDEPAVQVDTSGFHTCALTESGVVLCWGFNEFGQVGPNALVGPEVDTPTEVPLSHAATQITTGHAHTCALLDDGTVTCWGSNRFGQLGNGDTSLFPEPEPDDTVSDSIVCAPL